MTEEGIQAVLEAVEDTNLFTGDLELHGAMNVVRGRDRYRLPRSTSTATR